MGWIRVDDGFYDNPKIMSAGAVGVAVWLASMGWCNRNLTDGIIPAARTGLVDYGQGYDDSPDPCGRLVEVGLFHPHGHGCADCVDPPAGSYVIHDYLSYQPSRAEVEARRDVIGATRAAAGRAGGLRSGVSRRAKGEANREANGKQTAKQTGSKIEAPNPNPTPRGGVATAVPEPAGVHREPPPCRQHDENSDAPCNACKHRRLWEERQLLDQSTDELVAKRRAREQAESCPTCRGTNWLPDTEPAVRCAHEGVAANA